MRRSVIVGASRLLLIAGLAILFVSVSALPSYATDTEVNTEICSGTSSSANLTVTTPTSDSVIGELPLTISGTVESITQIDISVDGAYDSTVPIASGQTTFQTSLQLAEGTHTIILVGNDVCQFQNVTTTLVVTYSPEVTPSEGTTTPTQSPTASEPDATAVPSNQVVNKMPIIGEIVPLVERIGRALDLDATARHGGMAAAVARFTVFAGGVAMTFFGANILSLLRRLALNARTAKGMNISMQDPKLAAHIHRNVLFVRSLGVVLLVLSLAV